MHRASDIFRGPLHALFFQLNVFLIDSECFQASLPLEVLVLRFTCKETMLGYTYSEYYSIIFMNFHKFLDFVSKQISHLIRN